MTDPLVYTTCPFFWPSVAALGVAVWWAVARGLEVTQ